MPTHQRDPARPPARETAAGARQHGERFNAVRVIEMLVGEIQGTWLPRRNVLLEPSPVVRASSRNPR
jgi:hypothetical protein